MTRRYTRIIEMLREAGLRPTRQRLGLARLMFQGGPHFSAEMLHREAKQEGVKVSLATVYNTLHQFEKAGLIREIVVDSGRSYFDTITSDHNHFYVEETGELIDMEEGVIAIPEVSKPPHGYEVDRIDVVVRLRAEAA